MSLSVTYSTLEEHVESERSLKSPPLQQCGPNFDSLDTPPPLVDAPDNYSPNSSILGIPDNGYRGHPQPSLYDSLLIRALGPGYPSDIADRAGRELLVSDSVDLLDIANSSNTQPMIASNTERHVSNRWQSREQEVADLKTASDKLNDALDSKFTVSSQATDSHEYFSPSYMQTEYSGQKWSSKRQMSVSVASYTSYETPEGLSVSRLKIHSSPVDRAFESTPPFRPTLPSLYISNSPLHRPQRRQDSISGSPGLADSIITPQITNSSQTLPRLQNLLSPPHSSQPTEPKQTLPSLETALRELKHATEGHNAEASSLLPRISPVLQSQHITTLDAESRRPSNSLSPPRFSSNPAAWRTLSQNSSASGSSEQASGQSSYSTPGARYSPPCSNSTPHSQYQVSEHDSNPDTELVTSDSSLQFDPNTQVMPGQQGYVCTFPNCTAAPFQTQYLLNSHQNVHSNQRPHFCPVEGCPRGPGGQGFKRKNEMIRYVLSQNWKILLLLTCMQTWTCAPIAWLRVSVLSRSTTQISSTRQSTKTCPCTSCRKRA